MGNAEEVYGGGREVVSVISSVEDQDKNAKSRSMACIGAVETVGCHMSVKFLPYCLDQSVTRMLIKAIDVYNKARMCSPGKYCVFAKLIRIAATDSRLGGRWASTKGFSCLLRISEVGKNGRKCFANLKRILT